MRDCRTIVNVELKFSEDVALHDAGGNRWASSAFSPVLDSPALQTSAVEHPVGLEQLLDEPAMRWEYLPGAEEPLPAESSVKIFYAGPCSARSSTTQVDSYKLLPFNVDKKGEKYLLMPTNEIKCPVSLAPAHRTEGGISVYGKAVTVLPPLGMLPRLDLPRVTEFVAAWTWCSDCPEGRFLVSIERTA